MSPWHGVSPCSTSFISAMRRPFRIALLLIFVCLFMGHRTLPKLFHRTTTSTAAAAAAQHDIVLIAMFQNESPYLLEWIAHHALLGVSHFYLYDHLSTDDFNSTLAPLVRSGLVTLTCTLTALSQIPNFNSSIAAVAEQHKLATQMLTLHHFHLFHASQSTFALTIDIDEFLLLDRDHTLQAYLHSIAGDQSGVGGVYVERLPFTSDGHRQRIGRHQLASTSFSERLVDSQLVAGRGKIIYRSDMRNESMKHLHTFNGCKGRLVDVSGRPYNSSVHEPMVIVHHLTRSFDECEEKRSLSKRYSGGWRHRVNRHYCAKLHRGSERFNDGMVKRDARVANWMSKRRLRVCRRMWRMNASYCQRWKCCSIKNISKK